jgi:hypothetical protein
MRMNYIILECHRCRNRWLYRGNSRYYANCSICKTSISLKNKLTPSQLEVSQPALETESSFNDSMRQTNQQSNPSSAVMDLS